MSCPLVARDSILYLLDGTIQYPTNKKVFTRPSPSFRLKRCLRSNDQELSHQDPKDLMYTILLSNDSLSFSRSVKEPHDLVHTQTRLPEPKLKTGIVNELHTGTWSSKWRDSKSYK